MAENSKSAAKPLLKAITDIKADDPLTIVFTLSGGSADFPYLVSDYHLPIMPAKEGGGGSIGPRASARGPSSWSISTPAYRQR